MPAILEQISEALIDGMSKKVQGLVNKAVEEGIDPKSIINDSLLVGMSEVADLFQEGEMFVPEVLVAAKAMNKGMEILKPMITEDDLEKAGKVIMCTVKGDLHDIGKKLVTMMLEGAGYEVKDLGVDVTPEKIVEVSKDYKPDIVGMSAMLTTTMVSMRDSVSALEEAGLGDTVVMVGGAPVSEKFANEIGAHYAGDASTAVKLANKLVSK
ncbi:MAG: corrinoid protein [Victivallales bacterium]|nr:corrinoid protein [Victivallales bacterium]